jgi:hypothetical protein
MPLINLQHRRRQPEGLIERSDMQNTKYTDAEAEFAAPLSRRQDRIEQAVLEMVLELHPQQLTAPELILEVADQDRSEADDVLNAIRNLRCSGLLRFVDEAVVPTRAGLRAGYLLR